MYGTVDVLIRLEMVSQVRDRRYCDMLRNGFSMYGTRYVLIHLEMDSPCMVPEMSCYA